MSISKISELLPALLNWKAITFLFTLIVMVTLAYVNRETWVNQVCKENVCLNRVVDRGNLKKTDNSISYFVINFKVSSSDYLKFDIGINYTVNQKLKSDFDYFVGVLSVDSGNVEFFKFYKLNGNRFLDEIMFVQDNGQNLVVACSDDSRKGVCQAEWVYADIFSVFITFSKKDIDSFGELYSQANIFVEKSVEISE